MGSRAPIPTPPTGAFNALTLAGAQVNDESTPRLGITPRRCSANSPGEAIPATVRRCAAWPVSLP
jgi:hypothetical protein